VELQGALKLLLAAALPALTGLAADVAARLDNIPRDRIEARSARVYFDTMRSTMTMTFNHAVEQAEVRVPLAALGFPPDWRAWEGLTFDFHSTSLEPFSVGFVKGDAVKTFLMEPLPDMWIRAAVPFDAFIQTRTMVPLLPLGYKAWPQRTFTFERVDAIVFRMRYPAADTQLTISNLRLMEHQPQDDVLDRRPVIDRYGQWIPEDWPGKAYSDDQLRELWSADRMADVNFPFCPLGGMASRKVAGAGFFRTAQVDGRWVLLDPHGHPFYSAGMDLVGYKQGSFATRVSGREFLFEELPPRGPAWLAPGDVSFYVANIMKRYGDNWAERWTHNIVARLKNWGFNTVANWSDHDVAVNSGMPYVLPLEGWTTRKKFPFPWDFPDVFSDEFERNADAAAARQCTPLREDPRLIGWFVGNEPHWAREFGSLRPWPDMLLDDPEPSATKDELRRRLAADPSNADRIKRQFVFSCGRKYFETIVAAIRRHDPNHLVLGIRFAGRPADEWVRMSSLFDAFSINIYSADFAPDAKQIEHFSTLSGRPVLIGEFTACTPGRGLQGLFYGVHKVKDYSEQGVAYRYYVENAVSDPHIIGSHWFQMVDDLPTGRPSDQERLNYGFINVLDLPYMDLVKSAQTTHRRLYDLMFHKTNPYARKPAFN
jgi:hypothetical protein